MTNSLTFLTRRKRFAFIILGILALVCIFTGVVGHIYPNGQGRSCGKSNSNCLASGEINGTLSRRQINEKEKPSFQIPISDSKDICRVHFIDVGMGDSELIVTSHNKTILIDGGERDSGITDYLEKIGVESIDILFASHAHSDHIGGLVDVIGAFPVRNVITNGHSYTSSIYDDFLSGIAKAKASYTEVSRGSSISIDGITLNVLNPDKSSSDEDVNETSLMIRMVCGGVAFLFSGDAGETAEYLTDQAGMDVQADILKVGHHGSSSSTSLAFLESVHPSVAILSVGQNNELNLPNPETIYRVTSKGIQIYRTDEDGTILVTARDGKFTISTNN